MFLSVLELLSFQEHISMSDCLLLNMLFVSSRRHLRLSSRHASFPRLLHSPSPPSQKIATLSFRLLGPTPLDSLSPSTSMENFYCFPNLATSLPPPFSLLPFMVKAVSSPPGVLSCLLTSPRFFLWPHHGRSCIFTRQLG